MFRKQDTYHKVLVTDYIWPDLSIERQIFEKAKIEIVASPDAHEETLVSLAGNAEGIITCFAGVTANVLRAARECLVVSRYGVGVDNIDVHAATEHGIVVTYVPDYCMDEVSDHTMSMLLALNRHLFPYDGHAREENWGKVPLSLPVSRLRGKVLGIIGLGRIGKMVCQKAHAFGIEVLACDPYIPREAFVASGAKPTSKEDLLRRSDFVTLHTPLNAETRGIISERELRMMKRSAYLINCARGPIVDEGALIKALQKGWIAGAGLDVVASPLPLLDNPLFKMENVVLTPHVAFFSQESLVELRTRTTEAVVQVLTGQMPDNVANPSVISHARVKLKAH
jgi:D-3-phosphoglycerate dehydrogenase